MADDKIKIIGNVERIRYFKNSWGIISCYIESVEEGKWDEPYIICKGEMAEPILGQSYKITGNMVHDAKYGDQLDIINMRSVVDFDESNDRGKRQFLSSIFTPLQVQNMYEALSDPYTALKNNDSKELIKVKGCGLDTATRWILKFNLNVSMAKIFTELEDYNLTNNMIQKLMDTYGSPELVIEKVKKNPYILVTEVNGIGWAKADNIAMSGGLDKYSPERISSFILFYLKDKAENGCSWITTDELLGAILDTLGEDIPDERITEAIRFIENKLWYNEDKDKIGLAKYYNLENNIAKELLRLQNEDNRFKYDNWSDEIKRLENKQGWEFTSEQKLGIQTVLDNNVVIIHGYSGTGKTSLVSAMLAVLKKYSFVQTALAGRAASRLSEVTGKEGYTIHRLLGYPKGEKEFGGFEYHRFNQLGYDIYIVDEISMIGLSLFYALIQAIPTGSKLIMLGDIGQLESIGSGNIAHDLIQSPEIPTVELTQIHRQAAKSAIIAESIKLRHGQQIIEKDWVGEETRGELQDLTLDVFSDSSNTFYRIMRKWSIEMNKDNFSPMNVQVIVPVKNRGDACTYKLNNAIQELVNPPTNKKKQIELTSYKQTYVIREGDKVINTANNYKVTPNIYNGNLGTVLSITNDTDELSDTYGELIMVIDFIGIGKVTLSKDYFKGIELGYAITCHKFQGSEANVIIYGIDFNSYSLLTREQIYTGITRAKKHAYFIAQNSALRYATSQEGVSQKKTHLVQCLDEVAHPKLTF